jgi:hypothetical protein
MTSAMWYFASLTRQQVAAGHIRIIQRLFAEAVNGRTQRRGACLFGASADMNPAPPKATDKTASETETVFFSPASIALVPHLIAQYGAHPGAPPERAGAALLVGDQDDWDLLPWPLH